MNKVLSQIISNIFIMLKGIYFSIKYDFETIFLVQGRMEKYVKEKKLAEINGISHGYYYSKRLF